MAGIRVASRYARSLLLLSIEKGQLEDIYADMKALLDICKSSKELTRLLKSPIIKTDKKIQIMELLFAGTFTKTTMTFIQIITRKKRENKLESIASSFIDQYKAHKNIRSAMVTSVVALDEGLREKILEIVREGTNEEVELVERLDNELIGGFVLRMGDLQIDSSIQSKLNLLNRSFSKNPYIKDY